MSTTATTTESFTLRSPIGGDVSAKINFYSPPEDGSKPFNYVEQPPEGQPQRNFSEMEKEVKIEDIRGQEEKFNLDRDAFQAVSNIPSAARFDVDDEEHIKSVYYPEVEKLILEHVPGAQKVVFFDHTIRRSGPNAHRAPVTRAHVDQTAKSTAERVRLHAGEEYLNGRYRIINVWRPINGTVEAHPLGFASATSVEPGVLVPVEHRYPHRIGETAQVSYSEKMRWYYWSGMGNEERLFLKCWDSQEGVNPSVPHTAFVDPNSPPDAKGRESIEVRALVFG